MLETKPTLEIKELSCRRDDRFLFDRLNFTVHPGDLLQIEGPNGVGKTTLLRAIAGFTHLDGGTVLWQGEAIEKNREHFQQSLLFLGHLTGIKRELTPLENLSFYQKIKNQSTDDLWQVLAKVGLAGKEDLAVSQLSAGQQRRVALARLWLSNETLWLLDEPLTAIDKQGLSVLEALFLAHIKQGGMIIFTTHQPMFQNNLLLKKITLGDQSNHKIEQAS